MPNNNSYNTKDLGLILTPQKTVKYMISRLGPIKPTDKILDPCVGPGVFVKGLIEEGINKNQIYSYEISPKYLEDIKGLGIHFELQDTLLKINSDCHNQFDFIIGNPPYLNKTSSYVRNNKVELKKLYGDINAHETYSMFIVNSIWRLKEGGKLGLIVSDSFLSLSSHKKLRKYILTHCLINELLLPPSDLFSNQGVSINPAIIFLTKYTNDKKKAERENNIIRVIPRLEKEDEYWKPKKYFKIMQGKYWSLPFNIYFIDVEPQIIKLFEDSAKLKDYVTGYIGMHTHNNRKYIAAIEGSELADLFRKRNKKILDSNKKYKIISKAEFNSGNWKPYLKRGGQDQYYRPIMEALSWDKESINIYDIPKNVPFEQEGIVISGISARLAARYLPPGCYWDSNKAIGFLIKDKSVSINYLLGLLNSSLYNYLAKGIINNTNSIQITGIHALPIIIPDKNLKEKIEHLVAEILQNKKKNLSFDYTEQQRLIDNYIYQFYAQKFNFPINLKKKLNKKYMIY